MEDGKLLIFSAPSGAGKTSIVKGVLKRTPMLVFSVSACSRPMRPGEVDGIDYYFLSPDDFRRKINDGAFLEWEEVYPGSYYGTLYSELERIWGMNKHVVFDVDVAGALNIKKKFNERALAIFIKPPSLEVLEERLVNRNTETEESLQKRLGKAEHELSFAGQFDRIVVNDKLDEAIAEATELVHRFIGLKHES
ncbi:MAG: guanylate kinase [Bacteroidia bacterium]|nr:MAG: guanylate kinase [Bacteroidia bacterium]